MRPRPYGSYVLHEGACPFQLLSASSFSPRGCNPLVGSHPLISALQASAGFVLNTRGSALCVSYLSLEVVILSYDTENT